MSSIHSMTHALFVDPSAVACLSCSRRFNVLLYSSISIFFRDGPIASRLMLLGDQVTGEGGLPVRSRFEDRELTALLMLMVVLGSPRASLACRFLLRGVSNALTSARSSSLMDGMLGLSISARSCRRLGLRHERGIFLGRGCAF